MSAGPGSVGAGAELPLLGWQGVQPKTALVASLPIPLVDWLPRAGALRRSRTAGLAANTPYLTFQYFLVILPLIFVLRWKQRSSHQHLLFFFTTAYTTAYTTAFVLSLQYVYFVLVFHLELSFPWWHHDCFSFPGINKKNNIRHTLEKKRLTVPRDFNYTSQRGPKGPFAG